MATREQMNFSVTGKTLQAFEDLKVAFEVDTNTAVLRHAIAIALMCARRQRDDNTITIQGKGDAVNVVLNG